MHVIVSAVRPDSGPISPAGLCRRASNPASWDVSKTPPRPRRKTPKPTIGWREWIALPELGVEAIKVKVDTGARSSALHAFEIRSFEKGGVEHVRFTIHPRQRDTAVSVEVECPVVGRRWIRSSSGHRSRRPVIRTQVELLGRTWPIEATLTNRDAMGFRMLLGRKAIRGRFLVDVSRSYLGGKKK
jgi:hypothetical protein